MKSGIKERVLKLLEELSVVEKRRIKVRTFCLEHDINYVSLFNGFKNDVIGMNLADAFKKAIPDLNMNWFLYGEGDVFISQEFTTTIANN